MSDNTDANPTPAPDASHESSAAPPRARTTPDGATPSRTTRALSRPYLQQALSIVSDRYRRLLLLTASAVALLMLAGAGVAVVALLRGADSASPVLALILIGVLASVLGPVLARALRRVADQDWVAHRIEQTFPDLDARLLAAVEEQKKAGGRLGFLQQTVVDEALTHARKNAWADVVPTGQMRAVGWANAITGAAVAAVVAVLVSDLAGRGKGAKPQAGQGSVASNPAVAGYELTVEPGDVSVERGTSLIVLARFGARVPSDATLLIAGDDKQRPETPMSKSMDDPVFALRLPSVDRDFTYAIRFGGQQTKWYTVDTFDHPELKQADAKLTFPTYTNQPEKVVEDTRSVTAVEGTKAALTFHLTKPVTTATLVPEARRPTTNPVGLSSGDEAVEPPAPVTLTADPANPGTYTAVIDMKRSARYRLQLVDEAGRGSKRPAELAVNVTANRPPELKLDFPAKDVDVSPIEELTVKAKVSDDFGIRRVGVSYSMAGKPPQDVVLAENVAAKDKKDVAHTVALEKLAAEPDQLLSYYFWAEDTAPDGTARRTSGDMFFAEVRPFEEIFRQGEQPSAEEQEQQQQSAQQAGQNARKAEEAAENQKQIIAATWKLVRRETSATPTAAFSSDVKLLAESQAEVRTKAEAIGEELADEKSKAYLKNVLKHMDAAIAELTKAAEAPSTDRTGVDRLPAALAAEQAAYQELLRLRAREHEVVRGSRQQQRGQQSQSSANSRRQRQLDQLKLNDEQNRYEQQRSAAKQQQQAAQDPQQRETRQVLSRLRELAQRQEDLNKQMKEAQSALAEAQDEAKREEARRQLARLRDQQREMLRDTDELRDRTEQPANQEQMAEARQQLDQTREDVRKAAEALEGGKTPEAAAAGARAGERLNNLKEEFRRKAAGQFGESVDQMRQDARNLEERQKELSQKLAEMDGAATPKPDGQPAGQPRANRQPNAGEPGGDGQPREGQPGEGQARRPSLRNAAAAGGDREQVVQDLDQQKARLEQLLERMRQTVEEAEATEPLLSKQLYDAVRDVRQQRTDEALDETKRMVDRGVVDAARAAEGEAGKGIARLRQDVEQAAKGVLGDETEALRRARAELDALNQQLDREMARNGVAPVAGEPTTRPTGGSRDRQAAGNRRGGEPTSRPAAGGERQAARGEGQGGEPTTRPAAGGERQVARGEGLGGPQSRPAGERQPGGAQAQGERQPNGQQPGGQQAAGERQPDGQQAGGQRPGQGQGQGEQPGGQPGGRQPGQGQAGENGEGQQPGNQPGQGQAPGEGQGQRPGQGRGQGQGEGQVPGEGQARGQGQAQGEGQGQGQAQGQGRGQGQGQGQGQGGGEGQPAEGQPGEGRSPGEGGNRPGRASRPDGQGRGGLRSGGSPNGGGGELGGPSAPADEGGEGPMTGDAFRQWSDRLRDVEEMVGDPKLRAEAARIRERAKAVRAEADRHSKAPNWDVVRTTIGVPLAELRAAVAEELRRRDPDAALVPLDRDPVPPGYAEQVRRYYERLGSGK